MQVILTKDIKTLGQKGQAVKVKPGYFRNYLLPEGYAKAATKASLIRAEEINKKIQEEMAKLKKEAEKIRETLKETVLHLKEKLTKKGSLYSKVTKKEIAVKLSETLGGTFTAEQIVMTESIKNTGNFEIDIKLGYGVTGRFKVSIEGIEE